MNDSGSGPVAIFDSGVGGLSVLRHVRAMLPDLDLMYVADQAHVPYGPRPASEVRDLVTAVTRFCLQQGARAIVLACNTATAAALHDLRATFPQTPFVGMEPAVKPGAAATRTGKVGVLATSGTFESQRYADLMARFARDVALYEDPCSGLVPLIEAGQLDGPQTEDLLRRCMEPMLRAGVDTIVLGCTHYPFVLPTIRAIAGSQVTIIDPAPAVARQVRRVLAQNGLSADGSGSLRGYTTGNVMALAAMGQRLLNYELPVSGLQWREGGLYLCEAAAP
ncbi:MAG TPA: glutamate racemase [Candidatus Sulfomarinibacteraceae bacterium]|nr:glutamate racemase [Candidatus Sulfomarinibacteraceae bacterium]